LVVYIVILLYSATGMKINMEKSCLLLNHCENEEEAYIAITFPAPRKLFSEGLKYLGFNLNPENYRKEDWGWLIRKVEAHIAVWVNGLLSRGGRLILIKTVLEGIHVYWNSIVEIPKGVLDHIHRLSFCFLWKGQNVLGGTPLVKWNSIVAPKEMGGWGLTNLRLFSRALVGRNLWHLTLGNTLWVRVMNSKYFPTFFISEWFREPLKSPKESIVWKALVQAFPLVGNWTVWRIGNREKVRLGEDL
jgi:hypothetical protein